MTEITQADREAAASAYYAWISSNPVMPARMRAGTADDHSMVQAFARHRCAAEAKLAMRLNEAERLLALARSCLAGKLGNEIDAFVEDRS